jgi:hypothetical protein
VRRRHLSRSTSLSIASPFRPALDASACQAILTSGSQATSSARPARRRPRLGDCAASESLVLRPSFGKC